MTDAATGNPLEDPFADAGPRWMDGRTVLITGAGQNGDLPGVGYATAIVVAAHGGRVAVLDRNAEAAQRTVERVQQLGGTAYGVVADVTDDESCLQAVRTVHDHFGVIDGLVNNVAAGDRAGIFDITPERFDELMNINLKSSWMMTRHTVPLLPSGSSIVNISSVGVRMRGPGMPYCVAKAGVENFTEGAATTLGPQGIRVNCVQVGAIWGAFAQANMDESMREMRSQMNALKTEGTAWDIAYAVLFVLSDRARWISGTVFPVEGGPPHRYPTPPVTEVPLSEGATR